MAGAVGDVYGGGGGGWRGAAFCCFFISLPLLLRCTYGRPAEKTAVLGVALGLFIVCISLFHPPFRPLPFFLFSVLVVAASPCCFSSFLACRGLQQKRPAVGQQLDGGAMTLPGLLFSLSFTSSSLAGWDAGR